MSAEETVVANENETMENNVDTQTMSEEKIVEEKTEKSSGSALEEELAKAKQEIVSLKDSWQRERADFQNYKRRTAAEYLVIKREAVKSFVSKLFAPIDNLERVGSGVNVPDEMKPFIDGVGMILREMNGILEKENVFKVNPVGEVFDSSLMEAIASEESETATDETVVEVYQSGYIFKENNESFALRPARVKVARPKN